MRVNNLEWPYYKTTYHILTYRKGNKKEYLIYYCPKIQIQNTKVKSISNLFNKCDVVEVIPAGIIQKDALLRFRKFSQHRGFVPQPFKRIT